MSSNSDSRETRDKYYLYFMILRRKNYNNFKSVKYTEQDVFFFFLQISIKRPYIKYLNYHVKYNALLLFKIIDVSL